MDENELRKKINRIEQQRYRLLHPDYVQRQRESFKKWYKQNQKHDSKKSIEWKKANPVRDKENKRNWFLRNKDRINQERTKKYARKYPKPTCKNCKIVLKLIGGNPFGIKWKCAKCKKIVTLPTKKQRENKNSKT